MLDFLKDAAASEPQATAGQALARLLGALVLGWIVGWVYARSRPPGKATESFRATLVLLAVLIAIVTQVVGGNAARAFSLVGALSIVRFRTVVRDTQDTAFVIFAVVMGMAAGASDLWMSVIGVVLVSAAAFVMNRAAPQSPAVVPRFTVNMRVGLGNDLGAIVREPFAVHVAKHRLVAVETVRQGASVEAAYEVELRSGGSAEALMKALNRVDGVQNVQVKETMQDVD